MPFAGTTLPSFATLLVLLLLCSSPPCHGDGAPTHRITTILAGSPDLGDFGAALAAANLTGKIDERPTITVLAVDNAAMGRLRARGLPPDGLAHVISLHVLLDYFGDARLKALNGTSPTQAATLYQASGIVSVTKGADGRLAFAAGAAPMFYQKSVKEAPYDIAVLQVSDAISSPAAEEKTPAPVSASAPAPVEGPSSKNPTAPPPTAEGKPAQPPKPAGEPALPPKPVDTPAHAPAEAPEANDKPPADEEGRHKNDAGGTAPWSLGAAAAAAVALLL